MILAKRPVSPVITAPLRFVVNVPETPVMLAARTVSPVIVAPESVPLTRTVVANWASPETISPLSTVRLPLTTRAGVARVPKTPLVADTVLPVMV